MQVKADSVEGYLKAVDPDKQEAIIKLRETIVKNLPKGFEECINYGMIGYVVPKEIYPEGYHTSPDQPLPFLNLGAQKKFIGLYHMGIYANSEIHDWFTEEYAKRCKYKLDMGKSCVRLKRLDDIPYNLIGELIQKISVSDWINIYETKIKR